MFMNNGGLSMKRTSFTIFIILLVILTGCQNVPGAVGNAKVESRNMPLELTLTGVNVLGAYDVTIDPTLNGMAVLEGESDLLDAMDNRQSETGVLELAFKPGTTLTTNKTVKARVPAFSHGLIRVSGEGTVLTQGENPMKGDVYEIEMGGTGAIDMALDAATIKAAITGAGNITLSGSATTQTVEISGTGEYRGFQCKGSAAHVNITGNGNAQVYTDTELTGLISGAGNILYDGNPQRVDISGQGGGKAMKR